MTFKENNRKKSNSVVSHHIILNMFYLLQPFSPYSIPKLCIKFKLLVAYILLKFFFMRSTQKTDLG